MNLDRDFMARDFVSRNLMTSDFIAMVDSCIAAQAAVERAGTSEMKTLMRILLFQVGQALAQQEAERGEGSATVR